MEAERESIWSVPRETKKFYYVLFGGQVSAGIAVLVWIAATQSGDWSTRLVQSWNDAATLGVASATVALVAVEIWGLVMVLADSIFRKRRKKAVEETFESMREAAEPDDLERVERLIEDTRRIMRDGKRGGRSPEGS